MNNKKLYINKLIAILILGLFGISTSTDAQELDCTCTVNTPKLQKTDPKVFEDLQKAMEEFLNNRKWTEDTYEPEEKIDCNFVLTITEERDNNVFKGELTIQSTRPVYGSTYLSQLLSHNDKDVTFVYEQFQPLVFSENAYIDNLSSILSFYAYFILGLDYDSFSPYGGDIYLNRAQEIVNIIPLSVAENFGGWSNTNGTRNRYWMIESMLNPKSKPMRLAFYEYHRSAMDIMHENVDLAKVVLSESVNQIKDVSDNYQNAMIVQMFAQAKGNELIEIFKRATTEQKQNIYKKLTAIDPSNASKYSAVTRN